jgi:hypothetical protein
MNVMPQGNKKIKNNKVIRNLPTTPMAWRTKWRKKTPRKGFLQA